MGDVNVTSGERMPVYLVDDDPAMVRLIVALLVDAGYDVHGFTDVHEFLAVCTPATRGCILLDLDMPTVSGLDVQAMLRERGVASPILFITAHGNVATAVAVMRGGAVDVIEKPFAGEELVARVRHALSADVDRAARHAARTTLLERWRSLSERERDVFERIGNGDANKRVAAALSISERTVEVHRARVMSKMNAASLADLVRMHADCRGDASADRVA